MKDFSLLLLPSLLTWLEFLFRAVTNAFSAAPLSSSSRRKNTDILKSMWNNAVGIINYKQLFSQLFAFTFKFKFKIRVQSSSSKLKFNIKIHKLNSKFKFAIQVPNLSSKFEGHNRISMIWVPRLRFDPYCSGKLLPSQNKFTPSNNWKKNHKSYEQRAYSRFIFIWDEPPPKDKLEIAFLGELLRGKEKSNKCFFLKTAQPTFMKKIYVTNR